MSTPHGFCHYCGAAYGEPLSSFPRRCPKCEAMVWLNPAPVSVLMVPIQHGDRTGLLVVRRGIDPGRGKLALVGGFLEAHETWQVGGKREVLEETGVDIGDASIEPLWFTSTDPKPNRVLLFGRVTTALRSSELSPLPENHETEERGVIFGGGGLEEVFAFSLHIEAVHRFFEGEAADAPHGFISL